MAFIQMTMFSNALMRSVPVNVILPVDKLLTGLVPFDAKQEQQPLKTLYLLHGAFGSHTDWTLGTNILRYAEEHSLAVIMPAGDNSFYVDRPAPGSDYGEFVGRELVEFTRRIFPLSRKREDTFIGGLSMGGYGAMRNGLKYSDTFSAIISLSGALHTKALSETTKETGFKLGTKSYLESCFGDLDKLLGSDKDPRALVEKLKKSASPLPRIYMACGEEDMLLEANRDMAAFLKKAKADFTYEEGPGGHVWDFWDKYIKKALDWLEK
ncbi:MAG: acetylesterase [Oscillospiraceae bacterium]|nr:acetylesterase [Oscillospiraceae bacterium]